MTDHELAGLSHDEETDFSRAFTVLFPRAYRVAFRLLGNREEAEDAASEALGRAYARWSRVGKLPYREAWILRVTSNLALNALTRKRVQLAPALPISSDDASATRLALVSALGSLSRRQREVVVLRHLGGLPEAEVAKALRIGEGTVKTHTRRALESMRLALGDDFRELTNVY